MKQEMIQKSKTEEENRKALIDKFRAGNHQFTRYNFSRKKRMPYLRQLPLKPFSEKNSEFNSTLKQDNDRLRNEV